MCEALCTGLLHPLNGAEVAGLLSLFVSKGKVLPSRGKALPTALREGRDALFGLAARLTAVQIEAGVLPADGADDHLRLVLNEAMLEATYRWADGAPFHEVCTCTAMLEGDIIRVISRVEELAKEVRAAAWILDDEALAAKLGGVLASIKRDVAAVPSLYTMDDLPGEVAGGGGGLGATGTAYM